MIGWGTQVHILKEVAQLARIQFQVSCEVIDLVSILPWDFDTVCKVGKIKRLHKIDQNSPFFKRFLPKTLHLEDKVETSLALQRDGAAINNFSILCY